MQRTVKFDNGYTASIIDHGYGSEQGLKEIAVLIAVLYNGEIIYDTPVTNDVIGYLDADGVARVLAEIEALPPRAASRAASDEN